jgi:hypothetical protein
LTENRTETAKTFLARELEKPSEQERQVVERFIHRGRIARNVAREFEEQLTFGPRLASGRSKCWSGLWRKTARYYRLSGKFGKLSVAEEAKMSKARLIKRRDWLEREQIAQSQARLSSVAQVKVDTFRNWVKRQRASRRPSPREMFAALFVQSPTS